MRLCGLQFFIFFLDLVLLPYFYNIKNIKGYCNRYKD